MCLKLQTLQGPQIAAQLLFNFLVDVYLPVESPLQTCCFH